MSFPRQVQATEDEAFNFYAVEGPPVGTKMVIEDGRTFRFSECGATTALVVGSLNQGEVVSTNFSDEATGALNAAGVTVLTGVRSTGANMAISAMKEGYVYTSAIKNLPLMRVKDNTLVTASATTGTMTLHTPTPAAVASGATLSYFKNPWRDVIVHPATSATAVLTGICKIALAVDKFGWLQTSGPCTVLYGSGTAAIAGIGDPVGVDAAVAGAAGGLADSSPDDEVIIGVALGLVEGNTEQTAIFLRLE